MPKGFQVAHACPHLALRHMFSDTEHFRVFLAGCPTEKEVVVLLWYIVHRTDYFFDDFWKTSAAENILTIILGGKQLNRDGKHDEV